ncbi:heavy-metal-associated domain-containing protein [Neptunicella marina]|uniref:Heavy-metal-associated domain-containing protein n=1 Tax=Neptunicella marina TaxID=2125989 RepID=A0A8J6ISX3_9ALTE|nr:heavy-metal-associated domain-containing protein [Neptunicella marina]MBC3766156.1 heavy-metal-associated domain-containing protein [Neptunicella marina]
MMKFSVTDITCGHCVSAITKAILQLQANAKITVDLANKLVSVNSELNKEDIIEAIKEAGYTANHVEVSCCNPSHSCHS